MFEFRSSELGGDQLTEPQVGWVIVSLAMPYHAQHERRQTKRLGTGDQVESFAKPLHDRLLYAGHKVVRCHCM